ncbi:hypothetical protein LC593_31850 [Nostoc sp. CHAB 5844]|nr:hypothetical protein [Nostoc sp. CHAB 5844]
MTATAVKSSTRKPESPYKRLHVIIPIEDMLWASQQKSSVTQLWQECWDDVALWNKIKQLIAQYPEWGIAYADGRLIDGDSS